MTLALLCQTLHHVAHHYHLIRAGVTLPPTIRPRAAKRRETAIYTLHCAGCNAPLLQTADLGFALDERDHHGISSLHAVSVWVRLAGRTFRLAGVAENGREFDL